MLISCKCLNVSATILENDVDLTKLNHSLDEEAAAFPYDPSSFLKEASLGPFTNPAHLKLEIKHEELTAGRIQCQTLPQQWMLVRCLNCDYGVYAIRVRMTQLQKDNSDDFAVLFNSKLVTTVDTVNSMKADENYSKIYKIIIRKPSSSVFAMLSGTSMSPPKGSAGSEMMDQSMNPKLRNLTDLLQERLRKETEAMTERISQYTDDQFTALKMFRQAAEVEYNQLARKVMQEAANGQPPNQLALADGSGRHHDKKLMSISIVGGNLLETPPLTPDSGTMMSNSPPTQPRTRNPLTGGGGSSGKLRDKLRKKSDELEDLDDDFLFGVDASYTVGDGVWASKTGEAGNQQQMSDCDDDCEENLEDIRDLSSAPHIPGRSDEFYDCSGMLGKSLPIPTPAISIQDRHQEEELVELDHDNVDIAASIKALAKSVHGGDDCFEVPRPRFRNQM